MSLIFKPERCSKSWMAGAGPMPMISGGTPTTAAAATRASGWRPQRLTAADEPTKAAAAASVSAELLPPVCTPSLNTVRNLASTSKGVARGCVSLSASVALPVRRMPRGLQPASSKVSLPTGTISPSNQPAACAATALAKDAAAKASTSARVTPYLRARFSAVWIMLMPTAASLRDSHM